MKILKNVLLIALVFNLMYIGIMEGTSNVYIILIILCFVFRNSNL